MKQYRLVNNVLGWIIFLIAAFVYCSTIEPTASFWDCPEFIDTGYKLGVGHPPGAPFFMLTANLFSQFAGDPSQVARMVNTMSALLSATTILFLFWSITHLTRKLILKDWNALTPAKFIAIQASGVVGALIYAFSPTFWFSAVEAEVYAYSSAFTAVVFWLILKWEDCADEPHSDRWLVLIFYLTGLSIGVHLLNLLCIPAVVLVYVYKRFPNVELKGSLIALTISFVLIAAVLYGVVPGIITVGGWFELFFVNVLHLPFNTGVIIYILVLVSVVLWAIYATQTNQSVTTQNIAYTLSVGLLGIPFRGNGVIAALVGIVLLAVLYGVLQYKRTDGKKKVQLVSTRIKNTSLLCMLMLMIGYSTYAVIVIRSSANPPMDQNSPEDIFTLGSYLSRDQYGNSPLLYGQAYTSQVNFVEDGNSYRPDITEGAPIYSRKEKASPDEPDQYFIVDHKKKYNYAQNMFFPRMWDSDHAQDYEMLMNGVKGTQVPYDRFGETVNIKMPTQLENLFFFISYQCNFMYWRYFMWNFAGQQNDLQSKGELTKGNWITGFSWFDNLRLGDQSKLPDSLKNNKGHNVFYCLPLLLGILGFLWQAFRGQRGIRQFWVVFFLFFMTGLAIVIYLNQTPSQPRERDYAYAGSFYAFAIWCGIGVAALYDLIKRALKVNPLAVSVVVSIVSLLVPLQMVSQTWDDHDRSGRYTCRDFGQNYLLTLQDKGNPIIFTNGDNDTFPLWYNQDVEGVRTDTRVCNLSYLQTDWYIDQMKRPAYTSPSLPISWPRLEYCTGTNEIVEVAPELKSQVKALYAEHPEEAAKQFGKDPFELKNILKYWARSKDAQTHVIPTDTVYITIDKDAVRRSGMLLPSDSIPDRMVISLAGKKALYKGDLMMLEMIANANWTRPIYVASTVGSENYMNLGENFIQEGLANRITPFTTSTAKEEAEMEDLIGMPVAKKNFDVDKTYRNLMTRYKYGNLSKPGLYLDETTMRMCYTHRRLFAQLAMQLIARGRDEEARKVLQKQEQVMPYYNVPAHFIMGSDGQLASAYALIGNHKKAKQLLETMWKDAEQYVNYYLSLRSWLFDREGYECTTQLYIMDKLVKLGYNVDEKWADAKAKRFENYYKQYSLRSGNH